MNTIDNKKRPCAICGNLVPEKELPRYNGHKPDCPFISEWNKEKSNEEVADKIGSDYQFLENLAEELITQDNRATANPIYIVQQENRTLGNYNGGGDGYIWVWIDDPEYTWDEEMKVWEENKILTEDNFDDFVCKQEYIVQWQYVTAHLTQKAAELYIKQNGHNLNNPRIYVESQYRCHEFNELIKIIKTFRKQKDVF